MLCAISEDGTSLDVATFPGGVATAVCDETHVYWIEAVHSSMRPRLARMALADGRIEPVGQLGTHASPMASPVIALTETQVLWPEGDAVVACAKSGGAAAPAVRAGGSVMALATDGSELFVLVGDPKVDSPWHVERAKRGDATTARVASFVRAPYYRHALALTRDALCFTCGDRILAVPRR